MYCKKCGRKIAENTRFCNWCGSPIQTLEPRTYSPDGYRNQYQYPGYEMTYGDVRFETQRRKRRKNSRSKTPRAVLLVMLFAFLIIAAGDLFLLRSVTKEKDSQPQAEYSETSKAAAVLGTVISTEAAAAPAETAEPAAAAPVETAPPQESAVFESVSYEVVRDDRSVTTETQDGSPAVLQNYFDRISITEEGYPYKDQINAILQQASDGFLEEAEAVRENFQSTPPYYKGAYQDCIDVLQVYDESAILSIKEAKSWYLGGAFNTSYYTYNFDLATGEQLTLPELLGMSEDDTRNFVRSVVANDSVFGEYSSFYDEYFESQSPSEYNFYVDQDGTVMVCFNEYDVGPGSMDAPCFALGNLSDYRGA